MEIHINGLTKIFSPNIQALSDIYLDISEGEFVYLIGTTGSGKTTLMRMLTREVLPTRSALTESTCADFHLPVCHTFAVTSAWCSKITNCCRI